MSSRKSNEAIVKALVKKGRLSKDVLKKQSVTPANEKLMQLKCEGTSSEAVLIALLKSKYGLYSTGGLLVTELRPLATRKYRIDVALPKYKIGLEIDGIKGHAQLENGALNLAGFKRDREKDLLLSSQGWHIIRMMRSHIDSQPELVMDAIETAISRAPVLQFTLDLKTMIPHYC